MKIWWVVRELLIALLLGVAVVEFMIASKSPIDPIVIALAYGAWIGSVSWRRTHRCRMGGRWLPRW